MKKLQCLLIITVFLLMSACSNGTKKADAFQYQSYKEIIDVTYNEIDRVEELRNQKWEYFYGYIPSTDAFMRDDGDIGGFAALFFDRLGELFDIKFTAVACERNELAEMLDSQQIDFTMDSDMIKGNHMSLYVETDAIIQRALVLCTLSNGESFNIITKNRPVKIAIVNECVDIDYLNKIWSIDFEPVLVNDESILVELLANAEVDAFITENKMKPLFDSDYSITYENLYPLIFTPTCLITGNSELEPIISVIQKYVRNDHGEIADLYNKGSRDYLRNKLKMIFTDEEKEYITAHNGINASVSAAFENDNYPSCFYNKNEKEFQGIAVDSLNQISELTGLVFKVGNKPDASWTALLQGLENGEYDIISELLQTKQRESRFIWADKPLYADAYAILSRGDYPNVDINEVLYAKIGLLKNTAYTDDFLDWFPDSVDAVFFDDIGGAITAIENNEIDMMMATKSKLLHLTNYLEKPNFKINVDLKYSTDSYLGFNKDEELLCSIVSKTLRLIDTERIAAGWQQKVFDYNSKMLKKIIPYVITSIAVLSLGLLIVLSLLGKNRRISKNLEKLVSERTNELELQSSTLTTMFDSIPDMIFCKDKNLCFTRCNKSFETYFNCSNQEIIGKDDESGIGMTPDVAAGFREVDMAVIKGRKTVAVEEYIPAADGITRYFETIKIPLMQNSETIGIMGISRDLTRRKAAEEDAQAASRAKSEFLSRMSHEIRTPLNAIIGMIGIGLNSSDIKRVKHCLERADNASKQLLGIINDILDMSKIEADKYELSYHEFDLEKMLINITNVINFRAEEKKQNFIVNLNENVPSYIIGDELRLSQVIINLLTNAVKFTDENGTVILSLIMLDEIDNEATIRIEIADNGIGITEEQQKRLFNSFEQADGSISRKFGGTGLGLAISKRIVELMGGAIWIESELGKGSKFIFTIKAVKGKEKELSLISDKVNRKNIRILAVDDSTEIREYFAHIMSAHKIPCDVAASGAEALHMVKNCGDKPYNIFFIDWQMPVMNGIELTKNIKRITNNNCIVFMISVTEWSNIEEEAISAGVRQFIPKPLFPSTLINAVNECLGVSQDKELLGGHQEFDTQKIHDYNKFTILIAEDVEVNREIISAILDETSISIDFAENGSEALDLFMNNQEKYDLIFMDVHMPVMDGHEATGLIRALELPRAKSIPIVAMTANVFKEDIEKCLSSGMNDHIGKPIDPDALFVKLDQYLINKKELTVNQTEPVIQAKADEQLDYSVFKPSLDFENGLNRLMNNRKLYLKLLKSFKGREMAEDLISCINSADKEKIPQSAHALKGVASNLGFSELVELMMKIEAQAKADIDSRDMVELLKQAVDRAMDAVDKIAAEEK